MNSTVSTGAAHGERVVLAVTGLAVFAVFLDTTILFVAFSSIGESFPGTSTSALSWVLNAYTIMFAAFLVPGGVLADRFGRRRVFLAAVAGFALASALCGLAPTSGVLVAARALQAMAAAAMIPASLSLVLQNTPRERIPSAVAVWGAIGAVAGALGPALGALVIDAFSWRAAFLINVPVGIISVVAGRRVLPAHAGDRSGRFPDRVATPLVIAGVGLLTLALVEGDEWGWTSDRTLLAAGVGAAALAVLLRRSLTHPRPLIDPMVLRSRTIGAANLAMLIFGAGFGAMFLGGVLFLTGQWHYSTLEAGFAITPGPILVAILAPRFGKLASRIGQRSPLIAGGIVFALASIGNATMPAEPAYVTRWLPVYLLMGLGVALTLPQLSSAAVQGLAPARFAAGAGTNQALRNIGTTLGVAAVVVILAGATPAETLGAFHETSLLTAATGLLVALIATTLPRRPRTRAVAIADPA